MKFLIIEDLFLMRRVIINSLRSMGYHDIEEAADGEEAKNILEHFDIDFIITDWLMPKIDGIQLTSFIRHTDEYKEIPILMISTVDDKSHVVQALKVGIDDYIAKPFSTETIKKKITSVLAKRKKDADEKKESE